MGGRYMELPPLTLSAGGIGSVDRSQLSRLLGGLGADLTNYIDAEKLQGSPPYGLNRIGGTPVFAGAPSIQVVESDPAFNGHSVIQFTNTGGVLRFGEGTVTASYTVIMVFSLPAGRMDDGVSAYLLNTYGQTYGEETRIYWTPNSGGGIAFQPEVDTAMSANLSVGSVVADTPLIMAFSIANGGAAQQFKNSAAGSPLTNTTPSDYPEAHADMSWFLGNLYSASGTAGSQGKFAEVITIGRAMHVGTDKDLLEAIMAQLRIKYAIS